MVVHRDRKNRTLTLSEPEKIKQLIKQIGLVNLPELTSKETGPEGEY